MSARGTLSDWRNHPAGRASLPTSPPFCEKRTAGAPFGGPRAGHRLSHVDDRWSYSCKGTPRLRGCHALAVLASAAHLHTHLQRPPAERRPAGRRGSVGRAGRRPPGPASAGAVPSSWTPSTVGRRQQSSTASNTASSTALGAGTTRTAAACRPTPPGTGSGARARGGRRGGAVARRRAREQRRNARHGQELRATRLHPRKSTVALARRSQAEPGGLGDAVLLLCPRAATPRVATPCHRSASQRRAARRHGVTPPIATPR